MEFFKSLPFLPNQRSPSFIKDFFLIIGSYSDEFLKKRTQKYLIKLSKTYFEMKKNISTSLMSQSISNERNIYIKFLAVKFQNETFSGKVLGVLFSFNFRPKREKFEYDHLLTILKKMLPGIHILDESFNLSLDRKQNRLICYCEIEKIRGKQLNFSECLKLKKHLAKEIKDGIEFTSPDLWTPENEEQLLKDALRLNSEVCSYKDLPHVSISFKEQQSDLIRFNIILVRVRKINIPSIKEKLFELNMNIQIHLEKTDFLLQDYVKEIIIFSLETLNILFLRKNYAIDLLKARQYICMVLEQAIGQFRDYNGSLLSKQTQQFDTLKKKLLEEMNDLTDFESLFYSLAPANIQLLISIEMAINLSKAFYALKENSKKSFDMQSFQSENIFFIIIKIDSLLYDQVFSNLPTTSLIAKSSKTINHQKYHCLVQINPPDLSLMKHIQDNLTKIQNQKNKANCKEIRINFQEGAPPSFHPHLNGDIKTFTVCKALYEGLTRITPKGKIELAIAKEVKISSCKKTYVFTLKNSKWTNGEKITSYDFANAWEKAIFSRKNGKNPTGIKNLFLINNATQVATNNFPIEKLGIYTPNHETLIVELVDPFPFFLNLLAMPIFTPLYGDNLDKEPEVFNGPFIPIQFSNKKIELRRNKYYWDERSVKLEKITIFLIKDSNKTYQLFKEKKLDWIGDPFNSIPKQIRKTSKFIKTYKRSFPFLLFCNTKIPKLSSAKIRQALSYAIDRKKLTMQVLQCQKPSYNIIPEKFSTITTKEVFPKNAIKKALPLFKEGLKEVSLEKDDFCLTLNHSDIADHKKIAYFIKKSWEEVLNIKVILVEDSWNSYLKTLFSDKFEIGGLDFVTEYESILYFLRLFKNYYNNFSRWENYEYKKILSKLCQSFDHNLLKKAEKILMKELPAIPISDQTKGFFMGNLRNFLFPKLGYADFKWVTND